MMRTTEERIRKAESQVGQKFGKLCVESLDFSKRMAYCKCACGNERWVLLHSLKQGITKSCGCAYKGSRRQEKLLRGDAKIRNIKFSDVEQYYKPIGEK